MWVKPATINNIVGDSTVDYCLNSVHKSTNALWQLSAEGHVKNILHQLIDAIISLAIRSRLKEVSAFLTRCLTLFEWSEYMNEHCAVI